MLGLDIWIVTTKSKANNPYTKSLADMNTPQNLSIAPPLILGLKGECHYQSLLPTEINVPVEVNKRNENDCQKTVTYAEVVKKKVRIELSTLPKYLST